MNFLSRRMRNVEICLPEDAERVVQREIEITVERSWTSVKTGSSRAPIPPSVCEACGQALPCISTSHPVVAASHPAIEDTHVEPNR